MPPLSRNAKIALAVLVPVVGYLAFRWYSNFKAAQAANSAAGQAVGDTSSPVPAGTTGASVGGSGVFQPASVGGNTFSGNTWTDPSTGDTWYEISGTVAGGGTPGSLVGVWVDGTTGAIQYGSPPFTQTITPPAAPPTSTQVPATPPATTAPPAQLPTVDPNSWPKQINFGSWSAGEFTQIGQIENHQYVGTQVGGDVPVYANVFGAMIQGWNAAVLPDGTPIYIPTVYTPYEAKAA